MSNRATDIAFRAGFIGEPLEKISDEVVAPATLRIAELHDSRTEEEAAGQRAVERLKDAAHVLGRVAREYKAIENAAQDCIAAAEDADGGQEWRHIALAGGSFLLVWWSASALLSAVLRSEVVFYERLRVMLGLGLACGLVSLAYLGARRLLHDSVRLGAGATAGLAGVAALIAAYWAATPHPPPLLVAVAGLLGTLLSIVSLRRVGWRRSAIVANYLEEARDRMESAHRAWVQADSLATAHLQQLTTRRARAAQLAASLADAEAAVHETRRRMAESYHLGRMVRLRG